MTNFRLVDVVSTLEHSIGVTEGRRKAFRERLNFVFRTNTILNRQHQPPSKDRHDFHSFHRVATALGLMTTGLRAERCHHIIAPYWSNYFALAWAEAWLAASTNSDSAYRQYLVVTSDAGLEFATGPASAMVVRLMVWTDPKEALTVPSGLRVASGAAGYRVLDLSTMAKSYRSHAVVNLPAMAEEFDKEARRIIQSPKFWEGAIASGSDLQVSDKESPVALLPDIEVDIAYHPKMTPLDVISRMKNMLTFEANEQP